MWCQTGAHGKVGLRVVQAFNQCKDGLPWQVCTSAAFYSCMPAWCLCVYLVAAWCLCAYLVAAWCLCVYLVAAWCLRWYVPPPPGIDERRSALSMGARGLPC